MCAMSKIYEQMGKTACERRFEKLLNGSIIPFGPQVEYNTISTKDQANLHQLDKRVLPGKFMDYPLDG